MLPYSIHILEGSNFVDYVKIFCRSGNGGPGSVHFRHDKLTAKGGPDGGDGGRGGHVLLRGNKQLWTLLHLKYRKHIHAKNGTPGGDARRTGASGKDMLLEVPIGTVAKDAESGRVLFEITDDGQQEILVKGGRGGQGNWHFRSATNQVPLYAQDGEHGDEGWKILELKLLADVGLVGLPNAGKSTLLSTVSAAKPEIASYPFTTLVPNLGIVAYRDNQSFVMADLPGIIEGAHEGRGLGQRFLRHIERNSMLLFMVAVDSPDIRKEYKVLYNELKQYNPQMLIKPRLLVITKSDLIDDELEAMMKKELPRTPRHLFISSKTGKNIDKLKDMIWKTLNE